jgi:FAD/FMN-containing dehydrogenase
MTQPSDAIKALSRVLQLFEYAYDDRKAFEGLPRKEKFRIFHGTTGSTRAIPFDRDHIIDTSGLNNVLVIDARAKTAIVEPNVPMDMLVKAAKKKGLLPPVVPELPGLTVGGCFAGSAGESSSFKYGSLIIPFVGLKSYWPTEILRNVRRTK